MDYLDTVVAAVAILIFTSPSAGTISFCSSDGVPTDCNNFSRGPRYICCHDGHIPLPNPDYTCHQNGTLTGVGQCYSSINVVRTDPLVEINLGADALLDGNLGTTVPVNGTVKWDIFLGRQYAIYSVVLVLNRPEVGLMVEVQTRFLLQGLGPNSNYHSCALASATGLSARRYVYYCLSSDSGQTAGILAQNVVVTVRAGLRRSEADLVQVAEIQVYENQGLECGKPSTPRGTSYEPVKSRYTVGDQVTYKCENPFYVIFGSEVLTCGPLGTWLGQPPLCREVVLATADSFSLKPALTRPFKRSTLMCNRNFIGDESTMGPVNFVVELQHPVIIYQIQVDTIGDRETCQVEVTHTSSTYQSSKLIFRPSFGYVPRRNQSEPLNGFQFNSAIENLSFDYSSDNDLRSSPSQLFGFFLQRPPPKLELKCTPATVVCGVRLLLVNDVQNDCGYPEEPLHAIVSRQNTVSVSYGCSHGYRLSKKDPTFVCPDGRNWPESPPVCTKVYCVNYPVNLPDQNLFWFFESEVSTLPGTRVKYLHSDQSEAVPPVFYECNNDGQWVKAIVQPSISPQMILIISCAVGIPLLVGVLVTILICRCRRQSVVRPKSKVASDTSVPSAYIFTRGNSKSTAPLVQERPFSAGSSVYETIEEIYDYDEVTPRVTVDGSRKSEGYEIPRPPVHNVFPPVHGHASVGIPVSSFNVGRPTLKRSPVSGQSIKKM